MAASPAQDVALAHDYLLVMRGAERTFAAMCDLWPGAPVYTLLYDAAGTAGRFAGHPIRTSPLQRLGVEQAGFRRLLPLFPTAVRRLPLAGHRYVISSSSAFAHGVRKDPGATHVCYCHSPFRYAWHERELALQEVPPPARPLLAALLARHRRFDRRAAAGVDVFVANSQITRERIARFWGRESLVVHPPIDVERFTPGESEEYVLFVGELVRHKRVELAIRAARDAGREIRVVGTGPDEARLRSVYGSAMFLGRVSDEALADLYARAAALVLPGVEEFGITAVEAQAAGRPVIATDGGGARETVIPGQTGVLVPGGDHAGFVSALRGDLRRFDPAEIVAHAASFSRPRFAERIAEVVASARPRAG